MLFIIILVIIVMKALTILLKYIKIRTIYFPHLPLRLIVFNVIYYIKMFPLCKYLN